MRHDLEHAAMARGSGELRWNGFYFWDTPSMLDFTQPAPEEALAELSDEAQLALLDGTGLLDFPPDPAFDRITRLVARALEAPLSFATLTSRDQDFYLSQVGLAEPLASTRRLLGRTYCQHVAARNAPLVLDDVSVRADFPGLPREDFSIRAYIGVPIRLGGQAIGSLCAGDFKVRQWTEDHRLILSDLAGAVEHAIEMQRALAKAQTSPESHQQLLAKLAHDLRNPLAVVLMTSANLELELHGEDRDAAEDIVLAAERIRKIIQKLVE